MFIYSECIVKRAINFFLKTMSKFTDINDKMVENSNDYLPIL